MRLIKHSFTLNVKQYLSSFPSGPRIVQAVLEAQTVREKQKQRLITAIRGSGVTQAHIADLCGVTPQAVAGWLKTGSFDKTHLPTISQATGVRTDWLLTGQGPMKTPELTTAPQSARRIPVISTVQAADPVGAINAYTEGNEYETITVDADLAETLGPHTFALRVEGESMGPEFRSGDTVLVDPDATVRPGDIVVAKMAADETATLRKYRSRGKDADGRPIFELVPLNDDYPTLMVNADNPGAIIGPVVEHRRNLRRR